MTGSIDQPCTITCFKTAPEDALQRRVRGDYRAMPGMRLTLEQAMRMWSLDRDTCRRVLADLMSTRFLEQDRNGRYARAHSGY